MFQSEFQSVCNAGSAKIDFLKKNPPGYFVSTLMAGMFISFGSFVSMTVGGYLTASGSTATKLLSALCFAAALSLVIMAGSELFTGNNFVLAASAMRKKITWAEAAKCWLICFLGNLIGSWICVGAYQLSGLASVEATAQYFANVSAAKISLSPLEMTVRAIFCNILVCLAVWCGIKMKSESGKLIMIIWCIIVFMVCGFEHSVANMSILGVGLLNPMDQVITVGGYIKDLFFVTLGNMIGAIFFVAFPYHLISKEK